MAEMNDSGKSERESTHGGFLSAMIALMPRHF
jgi:hypothetical protein